MPINDPTLQEFYPRRLYTHRAPRTEADTQGDFCITNSAAAPAYRDWDPATGVDGLVGQSLAVQGRMHRSPRSLSG